jgi:hypothetical protein
MTQEGYAQAYQRGFEITVRLLRSRGASVNDAEDLAQAAWLCGWQKLDQLRDESIIGSWVNTIAINYHRRGCQYEARYQPLPELRGDIGIDLAPLDAAKILKVCRPGDRMLFEQQLARLDHARNCEQTARVRYCDSHQVLASQERGSRDACRQGRADCVSLLPQSFLIPRRGGQRQCFVWQVLSSGPYRQGLDRFEP